MGTLNEDLSAIKEVEDKIIANKVARFAYTDEAYEKNLANGVIKYNVNNAQNIPTADSSVLKVNDTVLSQGYRAQASSITRMLMNHFLGRLSYNVNKVNDGFSNLVATLIKHRGTANGFATLDENGRIPYSQLPESAAGDVKTVNNISPENGNIPLTGENIPVSSTDPTLLSDPLTTDRYANSSVTTEKIADNAVTNAKIKDPISVEKGGTGATTQTQINRNIATEIETFEVIPTDASLFVMKDTVESNAPLFARTVLNIWEYIKTKISSVLGLTASNYEGTSAKATSDASGNNIENTYATKKETLFKSESFITMANLGYSKDEEVNIHDFWSSLSSRYSQNQGIIDFQWLDSGRAYVKDSSGNKALIDGGYLIYKSTGSPNLAWNEFTAIYASTAGDIYLLNATVIQDAQNHMSSVKKISQSLATTSSNGLMSSGDKSKLDNTNSNIITCSTDAGTASKTVSIPGFTLTQGACIRVLFTNGNSVAYPTLNVNGTGAKEIRVKQGSEYVPLSAENGALRQGAYSWDSNTLLELFYTGTYWIANENAIVHENLNSELGYLSSRVFINGRKEIWGGTSPYDITANESKVMTISSDLPINDDISNHSLSVITEIESTYVNAYGDIKLMDNYLKFSIYSRNLTNNSYSVKTVHIFVTGY